MGWLSDLGNAVSSVASTVGDAAEGAVDTVVDGVEGVVDAAADAAEDAVDTAVTWVNEHGGPVLGGIANVIGGAINGFIDGARDLVHDAGNILKDLGGVIGSALRLDLAGVAGHLANLGIDVIDIVIGGARFVAGGYIVGAIVQQFEREALRDFVKELIQQTFGGNSQLHDRIRDRLNLKSAGWGLHVASQHRVLMLDSANTPLWQWHEDGTIDLYALAGLLSFDSFRIQRPRSWVRTVGSDGTDNFFPVNRSAIASYLESKGGDGRLRVYAMDRQAVSERLSVSVDKCTRLGVHLSWSQATMPWSDMFGVAEITTKDEYRFVLSEQMRWVVTHGLRTGDRREECTALGIAGFQLVPSRFGYTAGRTILEGKDVKGCATPDRNDACCVTIPPAGPIALGSSVIHRDVWPPYIFRYVLAHEMGHYLGLCHFGHDGVENIMYTMAEEADLGLVDWGTFKFYYQSEPEFTLDDGKNAWRFIVDQMACCLDDTLTCGIPIDFRRAVVREDIMSAKKS